MDKLGSEVRKSKKIADNLWLDKKTISYFETKKFC